MKGKQLFAPLNWNKIERENNQYFAEYSEFESVVCWRPAGLLGDRGRGWRMEDRQGGQPLAWEVIFLWGKA